MAIRAVVWGENVHEQKNKVVAGVYPKGMHQAIADALNEDGAIQATTATLQEPEHGLPASRLAGTDVLLWWGHAAHKEVSDEVVERVAEAVWSGMGLIVLHSGHFAKIFKRLMGRPATSPGARPASASAFGSPRATTPSPPGIPDHFELEQEEMYGEPFGVPEPLETVFVSWFQGGEVFRSGLTYKRGAGRSSTSAPGHETYPTYHDANVQTVLRNAVRWAYNPAQRIQGDPTAAPNVPVERALEPIEERGPRLHHAGEEGFR
jgi:trehalose utilization protein